MLASHPPIREFKKKKYLQCALLFRIINLNKLYIELGQL